MAATGCGCAVGGQRYATAEGAVKAFCVNAINAEINSTTGASRLSSFPCSTTLLPERLLLALLMGSPVSREGALAAAAVVHSTRHPAELSPTRVCRHSGRMRRMRSMRRMPSESVNSKTAQEL